MQDESKCFVCQSKSQSADDGSSSEKRRRIDNNYSLGSSAWKTFCHYFYPTPLVGLLDSSSSNSPGNEYQNEDIFLPVLCGACYQTILNLCNLHSQLEIIQSQISKVVAQVSLTFVQDEENHEDSEDHESSKNYDKEGPQRCDDNLIYSMRRAIRQRYQPQVFMTRCNIDIPKQKSGSDLVYNNDSEISKQLSPLSTHSNSNDLNLDLDIEAEFSQPIKEEAEDSILGIINNEEPENREDLKYHEIINDITDILAEDIESAENPDKRVSEDEDCSMTVIKSDPSENEDGSHGNQEQLSGKDSNYNSDNDDNELIAETEVSKIKKPRKYKRKQKIKWTWFKKSKYKGTVTGNEDPCNANDNKVVNKKESKSSCDANKIVREKKSENSSRVPKRRNRRKEDLNLTKVGDVYEYEGKWKYEKKVDEKGAAVFSCMTCPKFYVKFAFQSTILAHIKQVHMNEAKVYRRRTHRIDDNNFIHEGVYSFTRVTENDEVFFKCDSCGVLKKTMDSVKFHIDEHHINAKNWVCGVGQCGLSFNTSKTLKQHMKRHEAIYEQSQDPSDEPNQSPSRAKKQFFCEICGEVSNTLVQSRLHKETHLAFNCECGKNFVHSKDLRKHRRLFNHPSPGECPVCKKDFGTEENSKKHASTCQVKAKVTVKRQCSWCQNFYCKLRDHQRLSCKMRPQLNRQNASDSTNVRVNLFEAEEEPSQYQVNEEEDPLFIDTILP